MNAPWPLVKLKDILKPSKTQVAVVGADTYNQIGIRLWGEGAYLQETITGTQTQYKYLLKVSKGDFIFNKIWVRNGAATVIKEEFEGCYVSPEFPVFSIDARQLNNQLMAYITTCQWFWHKCSEKAFGTSGKIE